MRRGERQRFLVGTGHGGCTCQGAAFEYIVNLEFELRARKVRDRADITWISNEYELGDFGMGGMHVEARRLHHAEQDLHGVALRGARHSGGSRASHVRKVEPGRVEYETLDGEQREIEFDFAMLLPPFAGVGLKAFDKAGADITASAVRAERLHERRRGLHAAAVRAVVARGLAAHVPVAGVPQRLRGGHRVRAAARDLAPAPDAQRGTRRAGAAANGHALGHDRQGRRAQHRRHGPRRGWTDTHRASMAEMGAACVASAGANPFTGTAASMTVFPIVPDFEKYPEYGRDMDFTFGEIGLAGHWIKILLHHLFLHKARLRPGWSLIPE